MGGSFWKRIFGGTITRAPAGGAAFDLLAEGDSRGADAEPDKLVRYAAVGVWRGTGGGLLAD